MKLYYDLKHDCQDPIHQIIYDIPKYPVIHVILMCYVKPLAKDRSNTLAS